MGITRSRFLIVSICVLFILLMQSANGAQFFHITCLFSLGMVLNAVVAPNPATVMIPLTSVYGSL